MKTVVQAPGKINLTLEVLGRRPDGYHDLRSVLLPVSLFETVEVEERADDAVTCRTVGEGVDVAALAISRPSGTWRKGGRAMQRLCGTTRGCDIRIVKRVPIGAGMAGGSADAAGAMTALHRLWGFAGRWEALVEAGASVGSDVPALLHGGGGADGGARGTRERGPETGRQAAGALLARGRLPRLLDLDAAGLRLLDAGLDGGGRCVR